MSEGPLSIRLVQTPHDFAGLADHWRRLIDRANTSVFQTFEWQWAWWRHFGEDRRLFVLSAWKAGDLVGLGPWFLERHRFGGLLSTRRLRFIGSGQSDYLQVIAAQGHEAAAAEALAVALCARAGWDELSLEDVPESAEATTQVINALQHRGCRCWSAPDHRCFSVALPHSFDAYLARLSSQRRGESARQMRRMAAEGFAMQEVAAPQLDEALEAFITLHERQWSTRGDPGAFAVPGVREFHREVARAFHVRGWLDLTFLARAGERLAANYDFSYRGTVYAYLGGVDLDSDWARVSPGMVLNLMCIERAIRRGAHTYDLMRGSERYKATLGAAQRTNWRYQIAAPRSRAALAVRAQRLVRAGSETAARWVRRITRVLRRARSNE